MEKEVEQIYKMILKGYNKREIKNKVKCGKSINSDFLKANNIFLDNTNVSPELSKGMHISRYNSLYRKCLDNGNLKGAKDMLDSIAKINGSMNDCVVKQEFTVDWGQ